MSFFLVKIKRSRDAERGKPARCFVVKGGEVSDNIIYISE